MGIKVLSYLILYLQADKVLLQGCHEGKVPYIPYTNDVSQNKRSPVFTSDRSSLYCASELCKDLNVTFVYTFIGATV